MSWNWCVAISRTTVEVGYPMTDTMDVRFVSAQTTFFFRNRIVSFFYCYIMIDCSEKGENLPDDFLINCTRSI